jgi:hypothetical protein
MDKSKNPELTEDLYVTGSHAILYDSLTEWEQWKMENLQEKFNIDYSLTLDGKKKLIAYYDSRFEEVQDKGLFSIYHLVLESKTADRNYGIYANGILVESTDEITLSRMNSYSLVNQGYKWVEEFQSGIDFNVTKMNGQLDSKLEKRRKQMKNEEYIEDDIIKKKKYLEQEREKREKGKENSIEKSFTQKRIPHKTNQFTIKHF